MTTITSRRAILAGAAALPALAIPALAVSTAAQPDPIFALIELHREAVIALAPTKDEVRALEEKHDLFNLCRPHVNLGPDDPIIAVIDTPYTAA